MFNAFHQAKLQKHQAFEAEVHAHSKYIEQLDEDGGVMINANHFQADIVEVREQYFNIWSTLNLSFLWWS